MIGSIRLRDIGLAVSTMALLIASMPANAGEIITYGNTSLGVNDTGELNFFGDGPGGFMTYGVFRHGVGDAISPGCFCEGWGVATTYGGSTTSGFANQSSGTGGLTGGIFGATTSTASSTVGLSGAPITVQHLFGPSLQADIFQVNVTITNDGTETADNVVYRRVMDWDVPPTEFSEFVTHEGVAANLESNGGNIRFASDNGFANSNPLFAPGSILSGTINTDFVDSGPADHGSVFDFAFGSLAAGESRTFNIFYGSRDSEASALSALSALGVNTYSIGQNSATGGADLGVPATFIFAFGGVGGVEPGETEASPILPFVPAPGEFEFPAPTPRRWYDPPFATGFTYKIDSGEFVEVKAPTTGFTGPFDIVVGGTTVASILPGESYFFLPGVAEFDLVGIDPLLDVASPTFSTAFPTFLDFTGDPDLLTMTAILAPAASVPEPGTLLLVLGGILLITVVARRDGQAGVLA